MSQIRLILIRSKVICACSKEISCCGLFGCGKDSNNNLVGKLLIISPAILQTDSELGASSLPPFRYVLLIICCRTDNK